MSQLQPLNDRLILKPVKAEEKTSGGIILPEAAQQDHQQEAEVVAVGPAVSPTVMVGCRVIFARYGAVEIKHAGETVLIAKEQDILAVVA